MSLYDFSAETIDEETISLQKYKGKVLLIVNVASKCGFTQQYEGLQRLYEEYKDNGFMVLAFPSNQFLNQEPSSNEKIKIFCHENYAVDFDMFAKIDVNGKFSSELYSYLKEQKRGILGTRNIKWNFTKFLIDRDGKVLERFTPLTKTEQIKTRIEELF